MINPSYDDLMDYMLTPFTGGISFGDDLFLIPQSFMLRNFSRHGYTENAFVNGVDVQLEFIFEDSVDDEGVQSRYAGPVVIYHDKQGRHFMRPVFQFRERYVR